MEFDTVFLATDRVGFLQVDRHDAVGVAGGVVFAVDVRQEPERQG